MRAKRKLRAIRGDREQMRLKLVDNEYSQYEPEEYRNLLIMELPFKIDAVSLMEMQASKYEEKEAKKRTPFSEVFERWIEKSKDGDLAKNRRSAIRALIEKKVLCIHHANGKEMSIHEFYQFNSFEKVIHLNSQIVYDSLLTQKTYESNFRSLLGFIRNCIYDPTICKKYNRNRPLKKGVRPLDLSEAAKLFDILEKKAISSSSRIGMRNLLFFRILFYAGWRTRFEDVLQLNRSAILEDKRALLINRKEVKVSPAFLRLLKSFLGPRRLNLFEDFNQRDLSICLLRSCKDADIEWKPTLKSVQRSFLFILRGSGMIH